MQNRMGRPAFRQGGAVLVMAALVGMMIVFAIWALMAALTVRGANAQLDQAQAAYLADCRDRLRHWYEQEKQSIEGSPAPQISEADLFNALGIQPRWGLRAEVSQQLFKTVPGVTANDNRRLAYHVFMVWLPGQDGTAPGSFDQATGQFVPSNPSLPPEQAGYAVMDGLLIQQQAMVQTLERMHTVATRLQEMFAARARQDGTQAAGRNYFRAANCQASAGEIPCTQGFQPLQELGLDQSAGVDALFDADAWGNPLLASNSAPDAQAATPPFSMAIKAVTPWGEPWIVMAQQAK